MPRTDIKLSEWGDYENETLIHNHKLAKVYKKRYLVACRAAMDLRYAIA